MAAPACRRSPQNAVIHSDCQAPKLWWHRSDTSDHRWFKWRKVKKHRTYTQMNYIASTCVPNEESHKHLTSFCTSFCKAAQIVTGISNPPWLGVPSAHTRASSTLQLMFKPYFFKAEFMNGRFGISLCEMQFLQPNWSLEQSEGMWQADGTTTSTTLIKTWTTLKHYQNQSRL